MLVHRRVRRDPGERGQRRLAEDPRVRVVTGVNVPMLWRCLCYAERNCPGPRRAAVAGAAQG